MSTGEVKECAHCHGSGQCFCRICSRASGEDPDKVEALITKMCLDLRNNMNDKNYDMISEKSGYYTQFCSVCKGKGSVWIGPDHITINK